jgi:hypothetical protein
VKRVIYEARMAAVGLLIAALLRMTPTKAARTRLWLRRMPREERDYVG